MKIVNLTVGLKDLRKTIKLLRLDDAGEDYALDKACKQQQLVMTFELSGPGNSQRNGKVKKITSPL